MKKNNLFQIRDNINRRKKMKKNFKKSTHSKENQLYSEKINPVLAMDDEERHGYEPNYYNLSSKAGKEPLFFKTLLRKSVIAATVFFLTTFTISFNHQWLKQPKIWTNYAMTEEFPFATVNAWYQAKFGAPFAMQTSTETEGENKPAALPVAGTITQTFQENGEGVLIASDKEVNVAAINGGTVLFAGNSRETGKTVIIQHPDKSKSIYGELSKLEVYPYQSVGANETIGSYKPETSADAMYFAVEKNRQFMDPVQVIKVNEQS